MYTRNIILFLLIFTSHYSLFSQKNNVKELSKKDQAKFKAAQSDHKKKEVDKALKIYCKLLDKYAGLPELELWTGLAYKDKGKYQEALVHLKTATENGKSKNALLYSTIGKLFKKEKQYVDAIEYFDKYLIMADSGTQGYTKVRRLYNESIFASEQLKNPTPFAPKPLDGNINSMTSEYLPQFTADHSTLYFTRRVRGQEDIFYVEKGEDGFGEATSFELVNSEEFDEGAHSISADGNTFIFTHHDDRYGMGGHDLYITTKSNQEWSRPKNMGRRVNSVFWDSQPSLSGDGNILFFASTREGGYGGKDIWYSILKKEGFWSTPKNAGPIINTPDDESSPFLHADMRTLYFRSNGHIGMGSFDLFMAKRQKGGSWSEVKNLGYPINTEGQEGALTVSLDGTKAYFATDFNGENIQGHLDIYEFELPIHLRPEPCTYVNIRSIDSNTQMPVMGTLEIIDIGTNSKITKKKVDLNGEVLIPIPVSKQMMINVSAEGYIFFSDNIILDTITHGMSPIKKTIHLEEISPTTDSTEGQSFVLKNILFESGTADLREVSIIEITKLEEILKTNAELELKIIGHTDDVGKDADNLILSQERARSVKRALVELGVNEARISTEGKGESRPVADNDTEKGRLTNRRTEFLLY